MPAITAVPLTGTVGLYQSLFLAVNDAGKVCDAVLQAAGYAICKSGNHATSNRQSCGQHPHSLCGCKAATATLSCWQVDCVGPRTQRKQPAHRPAGHRGLERAAAGPQALGPVPTWHPSCSCAAKVGPGLAPTQRVLALIHICLLLSP